MADFSVPVSYATITLANTAWIADGNPGGITITDSSTYTEGIFWPTQAQVASTYASQCYIRAVGGTPNIVGYLLSPANGTHYMQLLDIVLSRAAGTAIMTDGGHGLLMDRCNITGRIVAAARVSGAVIRNSVIDGSAQAYAISEGNTDYCNWLLYNNRIRGGSGQVFYLTGYILPQIYNCLIDCNNVEMFENISFFGTLDFRHNSVTNMSTMLKLTDATDWDALCLIYNNIFNDYESLLDSAQDTGFPELQCLSLGGNTFSNRSGATAIATFADTSFANLANLDWDDTNNPSREENVSFTSTTWGNANFLKPTGTPTKSKHVGTHTSIDSFARKKWSDIMPGAWQLADAVEPAAPDYPDVGNVTEDDTVNGSPGTYHEATTGEVQKNVAFGAASALTGTLESTDPGEANVKNGTGYKIESVAKTGSYSPDFPSRENVLSDDTVNDLAGLFANIAVGNVKTGEQWGANGTEFTGSYSPDFPSVTNVTEDDTVNGSPGTYHEATIGEVAAGVMFGAASALEGTYDNSENPNDVIKSAGGNWDDDNLTDQVDFTANVKDGVAGGLGWTGGLVGGGASSPDAPVISIAAVGDGTATVNVALNDADNPAYIIHARATDGESFTDPDEALKTTVDGTVEITGLSNLQSRAIVAVSKTGTVYSLPSELVIGVPHESGTTVMERLRAAIAAEIEGAGYLDSAGEAIPVTATEWQPVDNLESTEAKIYVFPDTDEMDAKPGGVNSGGYAVCVALLHPGETEAKITHVQRIRDQITKLLCGARLSTMNEALCVTRKESAVYDWELLKETHVYRTVLRFDYPRIRETRS